MNKPKIRIVASCTLIAILGIGFVLFCASNDQDANVEIDQTTGSPSINKMDDSEVGPQSSNANAAIQNIVSSPVEVIESTNSIDPRIDYLNSGFNNYEFPPDETDVVMEGLVKRYGEFIYAVNLNPADESSLIDIILNILKMESYLSMLVKDGEISHEEFRRFSTTNEDVEMALSNFLTPDEMQQYYEFMNQSEARFLERFRGIQIMQLISGAPNLTELNRNLIANIFIDELARLRSGVGGVLSNDDIHTSYLRTKTRISEKGSLNSDQLQLANRYLDFQIQNFE